MGVPVNPHTPNDLERLYQAAYCMEKIFLELFARSQSRDINGMSPNPFRW